MSSEFGKNLRISIFGESHGAAIGVVVDGLPVGETVDLDALAAFLARRAPGRNAMSTARKETDAVRVLSGLYQGKTSGAPLCMVIENRNAHSNDYERLRHIPRPAHADYSASVRYHDFSDPNGGGHFSGRLTAPLCAAGGVPADFKPEGNCHWRASFPLRRGGGYARKQPAAYGGTACGSGEKTYPRF